MIPISLTLAVLIAKNNISDINNIQSLLFKGADINYVNKYSNIPTIYYAKKDMFLELYNYNSNIYHSYLYKHLNKNDAMIRASQLNLNQIVYELLDNNADIEYDKYQGSVLENAFINDNIELVKEILKRNIRIPVISIWIAALENKITFLNMVFKKGYKLHFYSETSRNYHFLRKLINKNNYSVLKIILDNSYGINFNNLDSDGNSLISYVKDQTGYDEISMNIMGDLIIRGCDY
jgi:hypothetical protein